MALCQKLWVRMMRKKRLMENPLETKLSRCLGTFELLLFGIGHMVGSGIYVVTGSVVRNTAGPSTVLSYALAGLAAFLSAMCYAEFSVLVPKAGSAYAYTYVTVGEFLAFVIGWNVILEHLIGVAAVGRSWSGTFAELIRGDNANFTSNNITDTVPSSVIQPDYFPPLIIGIMCIFLVIGAKVSANMNSVLTVINGVVLAVITAGGFYFADWSLWKKNGFMPFGYQGTLGGAAVCFYAYIGFEGIAIASEEAKNPSKSMPRAMVGSLIVASLAYVSSSLALTLMVPYNEVSLSSAFPAAFSERGVEWMKYMVTGGSLVGMSSTLLGTGFAASRTVYAMANDGMLFSVLAKIHAKTQTPIVAIVLVNTVAAIVSALFELEFLVELISIGTLMAYGIVAVNVVILRYRPTKNNDNLSHKEKSVSSVSEQTGEDGNVDKEQMLKDGNCENYGRLKPMFRNLPLLKSLEPGVSVVWSLFLMIIFMVTLNCSVMLAEDHLLNGEWWTTTLLVISAIGTVFTLLVIVVHEQNTSYTTFQVPFSPLLPAVSIYINITLMMQLSSPAWLRLLVWQGLGIILYFTYSFRHSAENKPMSLGSSAHYGSRNDQHSQVLKEAQ